MFIFVENSREEDATIAHTNKWLVYLEKYYFTLSPVRQRSAAGPTIRLSVESAWWSGTGGGRHQPTFQRLQSQVQNGAAPREVFLPDFLRAARPCCVLDRNVWPSSAAACSNLATHGSSCHTHYFCNPRHVLANICCPDDLTRSDRIKTHANIRLPITGQ